MRAEHRTLAGISAATALLLVARVGEAQQCAGAPSFSSGRFRIGAAAEMRDDRTRTTATLAFGGTRGFAELAGGIVTYDALSSVGVLAGVSGGSEREVIRGVRACPHVSIVAGFGPRGIDGGDVDASTLDVLAGVDIGWAIAVARRVQLVPHVGVSVRWARLALDTGPSGEAIRRSDTYGTVDAGVGAVFARRISVIPRVSVSVGALDEGATVSLAVGLVTGRGDGQ